MWIFSKVFHKSAVQYFTKIRPLGDQVTQADRRIYIKEGNKCSSVECERA
jgi:hypothetical protein